MSAVFHRHRSCAVAQHRSSTRRCAWRRVRNNRQRNCRAGGLRANRISHTRTSGCHTRNIGAWCSDDAEQLARAGECCGDHVVEREVGLEFGLVEIEIRLAQFLGVVAPVHAASLSLAPSFRMSSCMASRSTLARLTAGLPHTLEQATDGLRCLRHCIIKAISPQSSCSRASGRARRVAPRSRRSAPCCR